MPTLTQYTKTTEANIIATPPTGDGEMAYATDTRSLFFSDGTNWVKYKQNGLISKYDLDGTIIPRPRYHFDASDSSTMRNSSGEAPGHQDNVSSMVCKATGDTITALSAVEQPLYVSSPGVLPIGETSGDARINQLGTLQFSGSVALQDNPGLRNFPINESRNFTTYTDFSVIKRSGTIVDDRGIYGSFGSLGNLAPHEIAWGTSYFRIPGNATIAKRESSQGGTYEALEAQPIQMMWRESRYLGTTISGKGSSGVYSQVGGVNYTETAGAIRSFESYGFILGGNGQGAYVGVDDYFQGEIGEVLIFETELSTAQINYVGNYLSNKWGTLWNDIS